MIITVIVYALTSDIDTGNINSEVDVNVIKLGRDPVAESLTEEIEVASPISGSVILGKGYVVDDIRGAI